MFEIWKTSHFVRDFEKLETPIQEEIIIALRGLMNNPFKEVKKLNGMKYGKYRLKCGDYRIRFDKEHKKIILHSVRHRKDIYRD